MTASSPIARLNDYGQSPWYDNIRRSLLESGDLARMIEEDGIRGVTSNPTIFEKAISAGNEYDDVIRQLAGQGLPSEQIGWELLVADVGTAADILGPTHDATGGADGFVSIEVSPELAADTEATVTQARELHGRLNRPNVMVKIPATPEGVPAVEAMITEGRNINVTLIFSLVRYGEVIEAYLSGLERLAAAGGDLSRVNSVASFFVSRVDTEADRRLPAGHPLRGKVAVANAKLAYQLFQERHSGARWDTLAAQGAKVQRPLWASTSTKNPDYPDTLYIDELIGRNTVNTMAPASIEAYRDHGHPEPDTVERNIDEARAVIDGLAASGVDYDDLTLTIEREGVGAFARSYHDFIAALDKRKDEITT
ncbi:MAG: transaldolase / glucose-6-phosphate isomerase [Actinomycetota bacterium]|jgi:transaldolase|nr:transaldolase / glucose-6-phosphate isomerase [Actinomycetota bacterium]